jgi:3-hydroxyisobutyrate dehydrogenase
MTRVGYIGLGAMGQPLARAAAGAGFEVWVNDLDEARLAEAASRGARRAGSPCELARNVDIVAIVVKGDGPIEEVISGDDGVLAGARAGQIVMVHTTAHPSALARLEQFASKLGVDVVDAPMTGGRQGAESRSLVYMLGGKKEAVERVRPVLQPSAREIFHLGPLGSGAAMKLVQQTVFCLNNLAAHEGMRLAQAAGLDVGTAQRVLHESGAQSWVADNWLERYRIRADGEVSGEGWGAEQFATLLLTLSPAIELGREVGIALPAAALMQQLFPVKPKPPKTRSGRR